MKETDDPNVMWAYRSIHIDPELLAHDICTQVLIDTKLDAKACRRLISYLDGRFGPGSPYDSPELR